VFFIEGMKKGSIKHKVYSALFTLVGVLMLTIPFDATAQHSYTPETVNPMLEPWRWKTFPQLRGKGVRCLTEDVKGAMWFGIDNGIMNYDGYTWINHNDSIFGNAPINDIHASINNTIYAGGDMGLFTLRDNNWEKTFPANTAKSIRVSLVKEMSDGSIMAGITYGMLHIKNKKFTIYTSRARINEFEDLHPGIEHVYLPDDVLFNGNVGAVDDIFDDGQGNLKVFMSVSNQGRIITFNPDSINNNELDKYKVTTHLDQTQLADRQSYLLTSNGDEWLVNAYYKSGIFHRNGSEWKHFKLSENFGGDEIYTSIIESNDGAIWLGGLGKIYSYHNSQWKVYSTPDFSVPTSRIEVYQSNDGNLWLMGTMGEVYRIDFTDKRWATYKNLNFGFIDHASREWYIEANNKVVVNDSGKWQAFDTEHGLIDAPVRIYQTSKGIIWAAGSHGGIAATAYLKNNIWIKELHPDLSWGIDYRSVFESTDGSIWFGASVDRQVELGQLAGVLRLKNPGETPHQWEHYASNAGIGQQNVYGIGESPDGALWLGGSRLHRFDGKRWSSALQLEKLGEFVDIVYSSPKNTLWVGSRFYGLYRFDGTEWVHFNTEHGLSSNTIISVHEESDSSVWAVTDQNICWFDGTNWFSDIFSSNFRITREGGDIVTYNNKIYINHSMREWKRRAFPFSKTPEYAYSDFWTVKYNRDNKPPQTFFEFHPDKVSYKGSALVSWNGNDFWEETPNNKLVFSYRINDGEWIPFSAERNITLTELKDGFYTIEVRARDLDNNVDLSPASITFRVTPPVWKQAWFIALLIIFVAVVAFYETRLIRRNTELSDLNISLNLVNEKLERRQKLIEKQKDEIAVQATELENKNEILEQQNTKIGKQRDKLEKMIKHVEDLSKVRLRFFTNISHEFRTPLTLILCSIEQLINKKDQINQEQASKAYELIQKNTRRVYKLINQILEVRRIETGTMKLNPEPGDIVSYLNQLISLFNDLAVQQKINLSFKHSQKSIVAVFDHDKIEKILFNLISNAFKNTPQKGSINIEAELITEIQEGVNPSIPVPYIELKVKDTGKGIPTETTHQIFERFYQIDDTNKEMNFNSSGIGLSFVKDLVKVHFGKIHVKSELGKGSCFSVLIPYEIPDIKNNENPKSFEYKPSSYLSQNIRNDIEAVGNLLLNQRGVKQSLAEIDAERTEIEKARKNEMPILLVVEDEDDLRNFISNTLSEKFMVIEAANGKQGLEKALDIQPDLIISDIMMPEMDGLSMTRKIKENLISCHIPVILLTAKVAHDQKVAGYETGADAYIEKPFSNRMLKTRINNLLKTREQLREKIKRELILDPEKINVSSADDKLLKQMFEILEEKIADSNFDVESMSQAFHLSRSHFSRKIKQITNLSPKQVLVKFRLKRACRLLEQNKLTVSEIAYMVGFDHPNSFSRTFRKYYNMSPTEYLSQN
jgi:signal transduction histidine kinase/DNA-binding response OmpR family regulator/ligand-binding sensor domain-containing protein